MTLRTTLQAVTFPRPFAVAGIDGPQPAGTYLIEIDEELIDGPSFVAYRRKATRIRLEADARLPGIFDTMEIDPAEIEAASAQSAPWNSSAPHSGR